MALHSKRLFITGINGFTGRQLERHFKATGYEVFGTVFSDAKNENEFPCDILNKDQLKKVIESVNPNYIIHLAAISFVASENIPQMYQTNILGTLNLLEAVDELKIDVNKIIVASSAAVYGNIGSKLSEDLRPRPVNHYGNSKLAMEHMVANYFDRFKIIITRPFNYTGVGQEKHFLVPKIVQHYKQGKTSIELGNLNTFREYNDVRFICQLYQGLLESDFDSDVVNLASGITHSIEEILGLMRSISGRDLEVLVNPKFVRKNEIKELKGSTEKLERVLKQEINPPNLESTLREMYQN